MILDRRRTLLDLSVSRIQFLMFLCQLYGCP